jgi:hypothetical protein
MGVWLYRFRAYKNWLKGPMDFWIAALGTVAVFIVTAVVIMGFGARCEPSIRIAGLVFQLAGIGTVIWGIDATRRLFGLQGFFSPLRQLLRRRPPWTPTPVYGTGALTSGAATVRGEGYGWMNATINDPAEKRIAALEKNLATVDSRLSQLVSNNNKRFGEMNERQNSEKIETYKRIDEIENTMKSASTGGMHLSLTGAFWIAIGIIMSTIPLEISCLFCK